MIARGPVQTAAREPRAVPRAFELRALPVYAALAALSAAICSQINVRLGITPNTAVVGALVAIAAGRSILPAFRSVERQVMVETATSAGGFAGANIGLVSFATLYLLGLPRLFWPLAIGLIVGMVADIWLGYRLFGSNAFPAEGPWPDGEAVGRVIQAGDEGGGLARELGQGIGAALIGRLMNLPMAGFGLAFIGSPIALAALAIGLLARHYAWIAHYDFGPSYIQHGMMIGAGIVQVIQTAFLFWRTRGEHGAHADEPTEIARLSAGDVMTHAAVFVAGALLLLAAGRLWRFEPSVPKLLLWVTYAGVAALVHTTVVGYCAMLSGWFPSFALSVALILLAGLFGMPTELLAVLAGYVLSTGPQFADLGYDLKSGWIVRGRGDDAARERQGRRQQAWLQEIGAVVGLATAAIAFHVYWDLQLVPPMSRVLAATIDVTVVPAIRSQIVMGALAGMLVQGIGGPKRALGIMLATGLLLDNAAYGFALTAGLVVRRFVPQSMMAIRAPGLIAGDGLGGFAAAMFRSF